MQRLEALQTKQQAVLRRKTQEAEAARKRLKVLVPSFTRREPEPGAQRVGEFSHIQDPLDSRACCSYAQLMDLVQADQSAGSAASTACCLAWRDTRLWHAQEVVDLQGQAREERRRNGPSSARSGQVLSRP